MTLATFFFIDGTVVTLVVQDDVTDEQSPYEHEDSPRELVSDMSPVAPSQNNSDNPISPEPELWTGPKTRFLIQKYKELKDLVGKKGGFRQVLYGVTVKYPKYQYMFFLTHAKPLFL